MELQIDRKIKFQRRLWIIVLFAVLIRILCAMPALADPNALLRPDSASYLEPALSLAFDGRYQTAPGAMTPALQRPVGYPLFLSMIFFFVQLPQAITVAGIMTCILGALTCFPVGLAAAALFGRRAGLLAAGLLALNLTAIASAPLLLSDTLLGFTCACQVYFLCLFAKKRRMADFACAVFFTAIGTLIKPVNLPEFVLALPLLSILFLGFQKKTISAFLIIGMFFMTILFPYFLRNDHCGAGFQLDTNSAELYFHNGSAILAKATGGNSADILATMKQKTAALFAEHPQQFSTIQQQNRYKTQAYKQLVMQYPTATLLSHFKPIDMLLPDLPTFLENNKLSASGQNTLAVLRKQGLFPALDHYLGGRFYLILIPLPFLIATGILYLGAFWQALRWLRQWKWKLLMLAGAVAAYYLIAPGPVTMPRYQIPALPMLCAMAGGAISMILHQLHAYRLQRKNDSRKVQTP